MKEQTLFIYEVCKEQIVPFSWSIINERLMVESQKKKEKKRESLV